MRFNAFNMIHKALRARLYDTALTLQQTYFADVEEAEGTLTMVEDLINEFEQHAHHEDTYVLPAIAAYDQQLVDNFESEHVEDVAIGNRLVQMIKMYRALEHSDERILCGSGIVNAFRDFMIFNLEHMQKEEIEINKVLWENYTDDEILQVNQKIIANIPPEEMALTAKWMMRSINKAEAIQWLKGVKATAPDFVFQSLFQLTETALPKHIRTTVQDAVMETELV